MEQTDYWVNRTLDDELFEAELAGPDFLSDPYYEVSQERCDRIHVREILTHTIARSRVATARVNSPQLLAGGIF